MGYFIMVLRSHIEENLSSCEVSPKKMFGILTGFQPVAFAFALQCFTN